MLACAAQSDMVCCHAEVSSASVQAWLERMLSLPGVTQCSSLDHCKKGYFGRTGNNLVPLGPVLGWWS